MTFLQIYERVCFSLFGNSAVPQGTAVVLRGTAGSNTHGIIQNAHRLIQQEYNYWFMRATATISTDKGTSNYALPDRYKEMIALYWDYEDDTGFSKPLSALDAMEFYNGISDQGVEYPEYYQIVDDEIVLLPNLGTEDVTVQATNGDATVTCSDTTDFTAGDAITIDSFTSTIDSITSTTEFELADVFTLTTGAYTANVGIQWADLYVECYKFLPRLDADADYDDLTTNAAEAVIYLACSDFSRLRDEDRQSQMFKQMALERIEILKNVDRSKRQKGYAKMKYRGY